MSLFKRLFGPRWSLIILNGSEPAYALHENSVIRMLGYVMGHFRNGSRPKEPWVLRLTFNKQNKSFDLGPEHFTSDGDNLTGTLMATIREIDPGFQVPGSAPAFEELPSRRKLPLTNVNPNDLRVTISAALSGECGSDDFYSIMRSVFSHP